MCIRTNFNARPASFPLTGLWKKLAGGYGGLLDAKEK